MIETKAVASYLNDWRPMSKVMYYDPDPPLVRNFHYRINGIVYTKRSEEFIKVFNAEKLWYRLQNSSDKG